MTKLKADNQCPLIHTHCGACGCAISEDGGCNCEDNRRHPVANIQRDRLSRALMELAELRKCHTSELPTIEELLAERDAALKLLREMPATKVAPNSGAEWARWLVRRNELLKETA